MMLHSDLVSGIKILQVFWFWCQEGQASLGSGAQDGGHLLLLDSHRGVNSVSQYKARRHVDVRDLHSLKEASGEHQHKHK